MQTNKYKSVCLIEHFYLFCYSVSNYFVEHIAFSNIRDGNPGYNNKLFHSICTNPNYFANGSIKRL